MFLVFFPLFVCFAFLQQGNCEFNGVSLLHTPGIKTMFFSLGCNSDFIHKSLVRSQNRFVLVHYC